jgi:hypothetical protein
MINATIRMETTIYSTVSITIMKTAAAIITTGNENKVVDDIKFIYLADC